MKEILALILHIFRKIPVKKKEETPKKKEETPVYKPTVDIPSPSDIVPPGNIEYFPNSGSVDILLGGLNIPFTEMPKVWLTTVQDTNSMDAVVDYGHTCILVEGSTEADKKIMRDYLQVGEVVVYQMKKGGRKIIHRIIDIVFDWSNIPIKEG